MHRPRVSTIGGVIREKTIKRGGKRIQGVCNGCSISCLDPRAPVALVRHNASTCIAPTGTLSGGSFVVAGGVGQSVNGKNPPVSSRETIAVQDYHCILPSARTRRKERRRSRGYAGGNRSEGGVRSSRSEDVSQQEETGPGRNRTSRLDADASCACLPSTTLANPICAASYPQPGPQSRPLTCGNNCERFFHPFC